MPACRLCCGGTACSARVLRECIRLAGRAGAVGDMRADAPRALAENLGWGTGVLSTPQAIVAGWMTSAPHRANILDPDLEDMGVGIAQRAISDGGETGTIYIAV